MTSCSGKDNGAHNYDNNNRSPYENLEATPTTKLIDTIMNKMEFGVAGNDLSSRGNQILVFASFEMGEVVKETQVSEC